MIKEKILLSIIIPIYNSEKYIKECLNSLIKSKRQDIEFILIDDGSTDLSAGICDEYKAIDSRIVVFHQKNSGVSLARNRGIKIAKGKYLMFVDSDDLLIENWDKILDLELKNDIYYITKTISQNISKEKMLKYIVGFNNENICFAGPFSKLFKTSFIKKNKILFEKNLINGEDMLFNIEALIKCKKFNIINSTYYKYRMFQGSATKRFDDNIINSDKKFHKQLYNLLNLHKIDRNILDDICLYSIQMAIIVILQRIAYIKNYKEAKKYFQFKESYPYLDALKKENKINRKFNIIFMLLKFKFNYMVYKSLRIKILLNSKLGKEYYFKEI